MAAPAGATGEPDMVLIAELFEEISRNPPAIEARKLLIEQYIAVGWLDAANDNVKELKQLSPHDADVKTWVIMLTKKTAKAPVAPKAPQVVKIAAPPPAKLPANIEPAKQDFSQSYKKLQSRAKGLLGDLLHIRALQHQNGITPARTDDSAVKAIVDGRLRTVAGSKGPSSARAVARNMQAKPDEAIEIAVIDLEDMIRWLRAPHGKPSGMDNDAIREALVKRVRALAAALPENMQEHPETALMHAEHEILHTRTYVNDETMLGDRVVDIERANFWVTEDGYAWDMDELAQAITANGGIMRNPLSRQMFTPKDIRAIVQHPAGQRLKALAIEQHEMSKGVRPSTIDHLDKLGKVLLDDQSSDQLPSRHAIDEFMAYCATLPEAEQKALNGLRCPARDSHTGQSYDFSIGEAVLDAKGNRVCFHKTGDFIKQAAQHLRQNRGAPATAADEKCAVM
ncbi:uncharacterized protein BDZ99DRAFT_414801 [Mytilinidion resinicola]|uniref:Uncharacterized protein n=1 Tax=Mytilinidion resinicola TaxID=574789 RepID=A0A6A6YPH3_9PEZI|nr:uncharacterized protein BDZ99DRAFT_414801 [Mytilinidion resinicola]KAF2810651.1 hypothetical protein BDZ99DRAFT_414801 [Mytilinidion resinicola]